MSLADPAPTLFWSAVTIGFYVAAKRLYRRWPRWWLMPLGDRADPDRRGHLALHGTYQRLHPRHRVGSSLLLGPATVAFAAPIYEQRAMIRRQWPVLVVGILAGTATSLVTRLALATLFGLDGALRLSLLPRSISTPFAMEVSGDIGGIPDLTAVFVVVTGVLGAAIGDVILARLPIARRWRATPFSASARMAPNRAGPPDRRDGERGSRW